MKEILYLKHGGRVAAPKMVIYTGPIWATYTGLMGWGSQPRTMWNAQGQIRMGTK